MARVSACATPLRRLLLGPPGTRTTAGGIRALGTSLVWEKDGNISRECWLKAGEQGLLGTDTPEEHGGIGGDFKDAAIIMEEQSYVNCSGPGFPLHSQIVMPYITHYGSPEQIEKFIPDMTAGRKIGAIAMTEPDAGRIHWGHYGTVEPGTLWGLRRLQAHELEFWPWSMCRIGFFIQDNSFLTVGCFTQKMVMVNGEESEVHPRLDTAELFFEDVRLPPSALLGKPNQGFYYLMRELPQERLLIGIMSCANCEWQLEETRDYLRNRKAFGKTLSNLQTIRHKMAELKTEICVSRAFTDQCIEEHSMKKLGDEGASMCKYWLSDLQNKVAGHCVQLFGGCGYMTEYPISRAYVDAKVQTIYGGSNEIMKELIARCIFR
ncbi:Long-chain specific acyl-CoA dehydrogenase, mitochondrial [Portunus trituberculatus]|uniref:Long-chain specific acyl-CoA dehydrogenase, mitochondrial n=1 Tax=Portunus trituberculatus TaxID=210409 RepID=A0A5B7E5M3_PORTR|nr:Long-chain specific acyl-CoA dehydrogenase, mitochondrial [Portunus trituberculatus]